MSFLSSVNPSNDGHAHDDKRRVRVFLVEDGMELEQITAEMSFEDNLQPKLNIRENRMEIGYGEYVKKSDGSIELKLTLVGDTTMKSNNISGMTQLDVFIPAALRKD